jgi:hypothetical protein
MSISLNSEMEVGLSKLTVSKRIVHALADDTTDLGAGQPYVLTQKGDKKQARLNVFFINPPVDGYMNSLFFMIG